METPLPSSFSPELRIALQAAQEAGRRILPLSRRADLGVEYKDEARTDPVTEADRVSHEVLCEVLARSSLPVISEEGAHAAPPSGAPFWLIDPVDGTRDLVKGNGEFAVMIALVDAQSVPEIGVIAQPATGRCYAAQRAAGAWFQESPASRWQRIRMREPLIQAAPRAMVSRSRFQPSEREILDALQVGSRVAMGSCGLKIGELARGNAEIYLVDSDQIKQWDTAPGYRLILEAGGRMTDLRGEELRYGGPEWAHRRGILVVHPAVALDAVKACLKGAQYAIR